MIGEAVRLAFDRLRANPLRSGLTILGVVIGVAAVVSLVSIGSAVQVEIEDQFSQLGSDTLTLQLGPGIPLPEEGGGPPFGEDRGPGLAPFVSGSDAPALGDEEVEAVADVPGVVHVAPVARSRVEVDGVDAGLLVTTPELAEIETLELAAGSFLSEFVSDQGLAVAVVGADLAEDLGLDPGGAVGTDLDIDGRAFTVIGVLEPRGGISFINPDPAVIVALGAAEGALIEPDPDYELIRVQAEQGAVSETSAAVTEVVRAVRGLEPGEEDDFSVVQVTALIDVAETTSETLTGLISVIGGISLVVGAIGIANMMLVAVRERTREIGVRRAVGATRGDITSQFLVESVVMSLFGGVVGMVIGATLSLVLAGQLLGVEGFISQSAIALALGVSALVGVLAGIGPAWQAASVDPTTALRYE